MAQNAINSIDPFIQMVSTSTTSASTPATLLPFDNTIPQNTEGVQILSLSITPLYSTSKLIINFCGMFEKVSAGNHTIALFQDSTANALASKAFMAGDQHGGMGDLQYIMTSGTTSSTTFNIRLGPSANTVDVNSCSFTAGGRIFGGVCSTILVIKEVL